MGHAVHFYVVTWIIAALCRNGKGVPRRNVLRMEQWVADKCFAITCAIVEQILRGIRPMCVGPILICLQDTTFDKPNPKLPNRNTLLPIPSRPPIINQGE